MNTLADDIASFRRFNRMYTRFIGTLQEKLLETEYSLSEARVLYELGTQEAANSKEIAAELGLDAGYLSRMLGKFERAGLLRREASKQDGRSAELTLTRRGKDAFRKLDGRSDAQARATLNALSPGDRREFMRSMRAIEGIVGQTGGKTGEAAPAFVLRGHRPGDMGWVVAREAAVYAEEYGWDGTFEALAARIVSDFVTNFDAVRERCWIADRNGESVGHIFLVRHPGHSDAAKLRLLFVEPSARGLGLGRALVRECLQFARTAGYRRVELWTQSNLLAAHRLYVDAGFRLVEETPHHSFGKDLMGQNWELTF